MSRLDTLAPTMYHGKFTILSKDAYYHPSTYLLRYASDTVDVDGLHRKEFAVTNSSDQYQKVVHKLDLSYPFVPLTFLSS